MKKKELKLKLNKEKVSKLNKDELRKVVGGISSIPKCGSDCTGIRCCL